MSNIRFEDPIFFLLLVLLPIAIYLLRKNRRTGLMQWDISSIEGIESVSLLKLLIIKSLPWWQILAFASMVIAMARPQQVFEIEEVKAEGIDIMLAMDVSSSMLSKDFEPDRLEASKAVAVEFIQKRPYDRVGLAVFAGEAFTQAPLTTDHGVLEDFLLQLQVGFLDDGTAIGMGLATAINRLKDSETKSKVVILLTDGVNNGGYISPETAAQLALKYNIRVYTIGVGTIGTAMSPVGRRQDGEFMFAMARVQIDEELLQNIARSSGGKYFRATSGEVLRRVYDEIDQLEKTKMEITVFRRHTDLYHYALGFALVLILIRLILKHAILRWWPI